MHDDDFFVVDVYSMYVDLYSVLYCTLFDGSRRPVPKGLHTPLYCNNMDVEKLNDRLAVLWLCMNPVL